MDQAFRRGALNDACREVAAQVLWTPNGTSSDIVETLAAKFELEALGYVDHFVKSGRDPNLLTSAVVYLAEAHAIPPMSSNTTWFREMLQCLVELASPITVVSNRSSEFLTAVQIGIQESLDRIKDS
jgi:hypothetical protein